MIPTNNGQYSVAIGRRKWIPEVRVRVDGSVETDIEDDIPGTGGNTRTDTGNGGDNESGRKDGTGDRDGENGEGDDDEEIQRLEVSNRV